MARDCNSTASRCLGPLVTKQVAIVTYDNVLAPAIYRWHLRRVKRQASRAKHP
jgi:hypothetical protein